MSKVQFQISIAGENNKPCVSPKSSTPIFALAANKCPQIVDGIMRENSQIGEYLRVKYRQGDVLIKFNVEIAVTPLNDSSPKKRRKRGGRRRRNHSTGE